MNKSLLKEKRVHGDLMFPMEVCRMRYTNPRSTLECHWHNELELLILTEGKVSFQVETTQYTLTEGQAVFINSEEIHACSPQNDEPWGFYAIVFNPNLLLGATYDCIQSKYVEPLLKKQLVTPIFFEGKTPWEKRILSDLNEIIALDDTKPYTYELTVKARLLEIFSELIRNSSPRKAGREFSAHLYQTETLKKVLSYIQSNVSRRITLSELAFQANMSEGHFCRFFKQLVNKTPIDYINFYKVNRAAGLLEDSTIKISDAAMQVGFDNFSYFINIFRHYMNCTPSEYRRRQAQ
jgi:AraC-like DNA-binding protein